MRWREFAAQKGVTLCFLGIGGLFFGGLMAAAGTGLPAVLSAETALLLLVILWLTVSWYSESVKIKKLERVCHELEHPYLLGEVLPRPKDLIERHYYEIMKFISHSAIGMVEETRREKEEYCEYVESWIHEIKTPLTACSLILTNGGDTKKLRIELKKADNLTENILYYARMRTLQADTLIRRVSVARVMEQAIKGQMELLIAARIGIEAEGDFMVNTDDKALEFILKQLLINSAKYCPRCQMKLMAVSGTITVEDNGIGIPSHEILRVTERGFTGTNGRRLGQSTGMGLYLVYQLCVRLGIHLMIDSKQEEYTRISLSFLSLTET